MMCEWQIIYNLLLIVEKLVCLTILIESLGYNQINFSMTIFHKLNETICK